MKPGDLVFFHGSGFVDTAIRWCEWLRRDGHRRSERSGAHWNHVAVLSKREGTDWVLIQAHSKGVTEGQLLSAAAATSYGVVPLPPQFTGSKVVGWMRRRVGRKYGFVTILSILVTLFTPRFVNVMLPGTWICSAIAAEAWRFAGWDHEWGDIYQVSPAELYIATERTT